MKRITAKTQKMVKDAGYEFTGEFRDSKTKETYLSHGHIQVLEGESLGPRWILRKIIVEPKNVIVAIPGLPESNTPTRQKQLTKNGFSFAFGKLRSGGEFEGKGMFLSNNLLTHKFSVEIDRHGNQVLVARKVS